MNSIDYSQKASWYKIPEITKDVDTFYIYSTVTMSANEGDPDYATLDNTEMLDFEVKRVRSSLPVKSGMDPAIIM